MRYRNAFALSLLLVIAALVYGLLRTSHLPDMVPTHWDANGNVNGYSPKMVAVFMLPGIMVLMLVLTIALPKMSPKGYDPLEFAETFNKIMLMVQGLLIYIHVISLESAVNPSMNSGKWVMAGMFLLWAMMGNLMGKVRQNYWMGIRVPWTLSNRQVWDQTHREAGRLWVAVGIIGLVLVLINVPIWIPFTLLIISAFWPIVSSYLLWKRIEPS